MTPGPARSGRIATCTASVLAEAAFGMCRTLNVWWQINSPGASRFSRIGFYTSCEGATDKARRRRIFRQLSSLSAAQSRVHRECPDRMEASCAGLRKAAWLDQRPVQYEAFRALNRFEFTPWSMLNDYFMEIRRHDRASYQKT